MAAVETSEHSRIAEGADGTAPVPGAGRANERPENARLTCALDLGWRVAELYAVSDDLEEPATHGLLPAHDQLPWADQLELQVRAAAGDARLSGADAGAEMLRGLVPAARAVPTSRGGCEAFRADLLSCHVALAKELWAQQEATGKAYELGIGLSDTYSRIARAYRSAGGGADAVRQEWRDTFSEHRMEKIKKFLNDLQSRLDPSGVMVVNDHLDAWRAMVEANIDEARKPPPIDRVRDALRRQTVIWRQLLAGDKRPEAYLDRDRRSEIQDELRKLVWQRYRRWAWVPAVVAGGVIFALLNYDDVSSWVEENVVTSGLGAAILAVLGAFGVTKASVALTLRKRVDQWSQLLWNRALAQKVTDVTLTSDEVFDAAPPKGVVARVQAHVPRSPAAGAAGGRA